ncbi:MAG: hypothetical protein H6732_18640 [Alphaproteobacteria bacterium]|nr:hypothetical protein [Alphaproteobacteria bacterium]
MPRTLLLSLCLACAAPDAGKGDTDSTADTVETAVPGLATRWAARPLLTAPAPVLPTSVESCGVVQATRCVDGQPQVCAATDAAGAPAAASLPRQRAWVLDRQLDLFFRRDASVLTFETDVAMDPGTPEAVWAAPEHFTEWADHGDAAYHMGHLTWAAALRYALTGSEADYARMVDHVERQLVNWRVSGARGSMVRAPFGMLDPGVDVPQGHPELGLHDHKERTNHVIYTLTDDALAHLPDHYDGPLEVDGQTLQVTGTAEGSPSLDAYSGALLGLLHAHDLLRPEDAGLAEEIADDVVCHLHRYRRLRISNLQAAEGIRLALSSLLGTGTYAAEEGELDLSGIDVIHGYVMDAVPPDGVPDGTYERGCREGPPRTVDPELDLDASEPGFIFTLLDLVRRMQGLGDHPIDFVYFTNLRAGDALYVLDLAVQAWWLTGDEAYLELIEEDLVAEQGLLDVLPTLDHFRLPDFCGDWIGNDLVHPIARMILDRLEDHDQPVARAVVETMTESYRFGVLETQGNSFFQLTYAAYADPLLDPTLDETTAAALADVAGYVPEPDHPFDPKRARTRDWTDSGLPWVQPREPSADDLVTCTQDVEVLGITIAAPGLVDTVLNTTPVPAGYRTKETEIWHFNPFRLRRGFGNSGRGHELFTDYTLPYWMAAVDGRWEAEAVGLAWQPGGEGCGG